MAKSCSQMYLNGQIQSLKLFQSFYVPSKALDIRRLYVLNWPCACKKMSVQNTAHLLKSRFCSFFYLSICEYFRFTDVGFVQLKLQRNWSPLPIIHVSGSLHFALLIQVPQSVHLYILKFLNSPHKGTNSTMSPPNIIYR